MATTIQTTEELMTGPRVLAGRRRIISDFDEVTAENVTELIRNTETIHHTNSAEINYLYRYYRGLQPVMNREKPVRPEIKNIVVENRANEIVSFKTGYLMGEPVSYVARTDTEQVVANIEKLNAFTFSEDKASQDKELADWMHICGVGYRICVPDERYEDDSSSDRDESPFELTVLDPRFTYVVYRNDLSHSVLAGVTVVPPVDSNGDTTHYVYSRDRFYTIVGGNIIRTEVNPLGMVPIIEYPANTARIGAFEVVLPLLDAINNVDSNRLDSVEQTVQSLLLFHNVNIDDSGFDEMRKQGALKFKDMDATLKAEIKYITAEISQTETQTLVDHLYDTVLTICGMPNRNGGSSTSDTGTAVIMRDGWSAAEARAKDTELMFKRAEKQMIRLMLKVCDTVAHIKLNLSDIDIRFTRRNYENIQGKAQVLTQLLNCADVPPRLAYEQCNMFVDVENAYQQYLEWHEQQKEEAQKIAEQTGNGDRTDPAAAGNSQNPAEGEHGGDQEEEE